jgi:hypothetical protein
VLGADDDFDCGELVAAGSRSTATCSTRLAQNTTETVTVHYFGDETYAVTEASADVSIGGW